MHARQSPWNKELIDAAKRGNVELLRKALANCARPEYRDNEAIRLASERGHLQVVQELLKYQSVNPAEYDNSALYSAAGNGHLSVVQCLLKDDRVNPVGSKALNIASYKGHVPIVDALLQDGRDDPVDSDQYAIHTASAEGHVDVVDRLLRDERVDPSEPHFPALPIVVAAKFGHKQVVRRLLRDKRVDPSAQQNSAVKSAACNGHAEVVSLLLQDARVTATATNDFAMREVLERRHDDVLAILLKHPCTHSFYERFCTMDGLPTVARSPTARQILVYYEQRPKPPILARAQRHFEDETMMGARLGRMLGPELMNRISLYWNAQQ